MATLSSCECELVLPGLIMRARSRCFKCGKGIILFDGIIREYATNSDMNGRPATQALLSRLSAVAENSRSRRRGEAIFDIHAPACATNRKRVRPCDRNRKSLKLHHLGAFLLLSHVRVCDFSLERCDTSQWSSSQCMGGWTRTSAPCRP